MKMLGAGYEILSCFVYYFSRTALVQDGADEASTSMNISYFDDIERYLWRTIPQFRLNLSWILHKSYRRRDKDLESNFSLKENNVENASYHSNKFLT